MKSHAFQFAVVVLLGMSNSQTVVAQTDDLKNYLVDIGPGSVGAHEMIGVNSSAISAIQTPKDFIAAVHAVNGDAGKSGFGLAFTPARSGFRLLALEIDQYSQKGNLAARLWGGTTFSYAQNENKFGDLDYQQQAVAVQVNYFLHSEEDPVIAARSAFLKCDAIPKDMTKVGQEVLRRWGAEKKKMENMGLKLTDEINLGLQADIKAAVQADFAASALKCISQGFDRAKSKWNASQLGLTLGQGWIRNPAGGLGRTSLGRHIAVTLAWAPPGWDNSLFNVTARRVSREVDTSTLAGTPVFKSSSLAAVRYTYGYGDEQDTFLIAELSNAKANKPTESNTAFKSALGIDRRMGKGVWLEMRAGRSQSLALGKTETKVLFNLKLSPEASLPTLSGN